MNYNAVFLSLLVLACCSERNNENSNEIAFIFNNKKFYIEEIDSKCQEEIYSVRKNEIVKVVDNEILNLQAEKAGLTYDQLIEQEVYNKVKPISENDITNYLKFASNQDISRQQARMYLESNQLNDRRLNYLDSLKQKMNFQMKLQKPIKKIVETEDILYNSLTASKNSIDVFIISDYKCKKCRVIKDELNMLIKKFDNVSFKHVYFSSYIDKSALAAEAANNQEKFEAMYEFLYGTQEWLRNDSLFIQVAWDLNMNMEQFELDIKSTDIIKELIENKERLLKKGIQSTPSYIVNGKLIDDEYALHYLDELIRNEL